MSVHNFYKNPEYIKKQRESHLGNKNWNWKGGITKPFVKGQGKTKMIQEDYLKSDKNPFNKREVKSKGGKNNYKY